MHINNKTCQSEPHFCDKFQNGCYNSKGSILHAYLIKVDIIKQDVTEAFVLILDIIIKYNFIAQKIMSLISMCTINNYVCSPILSAIFDLSLSDNFVRFVDTSFLRSALSTSSPSSRTRPSFFS